MQGLLDFLLPPMLVLFSVYMVVVLVRMFRAPARDMMSVGKENTEAVRENSALLRELIAVNKQLLEKKSETES
jgi:hypothetical protein